jgi:glucokinase
MIGAVDIGGTKFAVGIFSETGELLARAESPSHPGQGVARGVESICRMLHETSEQVAGSLQGIGIGCTGPVEPFTGRLGPNAFLPGWEGLNLVDELQREFGVPAVMENDADAAALGEHAWGSGIDIDRFIYITVSTGIGGGIVLDGKLYRGADGSHPEMGHHVIDPSGPQCFCGAHGCWESLAGGPALAKRGRRATALEVCEAARRTEPEPLAAVEQEGIYLGLGLANLVTLFVPDVIALGGGVMQSLDLFRDKIHETIRSTCGLVPFEKTRILPAALGRDAVLAGTAQVWIKRFGQ